MQVITDEQLVRIAQQELFKNLTKSFPHSKILNVRVLAGIHEIEIHYDSNIWYAYKEIKGRHLNAFGLLGPNNQYLSTEFQLSIPISGVNKRMGGIFGTENGKTFLLYRGLISGKTGVYKSEFLDQHKGKKCTLSEGNLDVLIFGNVKDEGLLAVIFNYIQSVKQFKSGVVLPDRSEKD